jgi:hypothetical protein
MTIVEQTPISLPTDQCDIVNATIYRTGNYPNQRYNVTISNVPARLSKEYSNDDLYRLWAEQHPEWDALISYFC